MKISEAENKEMLAKWIINYLMPEAKRRKCSIWDLGIKPNEFFWLVELTRVGILNSHESRNILKEKINEEKTETGRQDNFVSANCKSATCFGDRRN